MTPAPPTGGNECDTNKLLACEPRHWVASRHDPAATMKQCQDRCKDAGLDYATKFAAGACYCCHTGETNVPAWAKPDTPASAWSGRYDCTMANSEPPPTPPPPPP